MIAFIIFSIIFVLLVSGMLFFIFRMLIPSIKTDSASSDDFLFSKEEIIVATGEPEFKQNKTGLKAVVLCSSKRKFSNKRVNYKGKKDCSLFKSIYSTEYDCTWSCSGFGNCVDACPRQAIFIENNTAVVDTGLCNGCGLCVSSCPKHLIELIPETQNVCEHCKADPSEKNTCSMYCKQIKTDFYKKKNFEFWEKCYKILTRK